MSEKHTTVEEVQSRSNSSSASIDKGQVYVDEKVGLDDQDPARFSINSGDQEVHHLATELQEHLGRALGVSEHDIDYVHNIIRSMTVEEAHEILTTALKEHEFDRNFSAKTLETIKNMLEGEHDGTFDIEGVDREFAMKAEAALIHYHSPYPDVRAVTDPYDVEQSVETFRAYVLGTIWVIVGTGVNQFFQPRNPPISIPASLFQLLVLPCGWTAAKILPDWGFTFRGTRYTLNPGPWTAKEQVLTTIMFGITASIPYVDSQIMVQKLPMFYDQKWADAGYQFLLTLSTQFLGFGIAGLMRSVLVYPAHQLWMGNFPTLALNRSLMSKEDGSLANGWKIPRYSFFGIAFGAMFLYEWLPVYLMQFLQYFNWMTWIKPDNYNLAAITGSLTGLGVNPISTFDWQYINYATPLVTPFFSMANMMIGSILGACVLIPAVFYSNMYYSSYLPINSSKLFTNEGKRYQVLEILSEDSLLDEQKYQAYSPPYYSAANLVLYGVFFANYTSIFVRTLLYDWKIMYKGYVEIFWSLLGKGKGIKAHNDAHSRMMAKYPETPMWWFVAVLLVALALGIATIKAYPTRTPVWGIFFSIALGIVFLVPIGNLYAQTNSLFSLNVLAELVAGYAVEGNGIAMMIIKAFGLNTNLQAMYFMQDLKLGHYAKIPPRATFRAQMVATLFSALVMIGVVNWQMSNIDDLCSADTDGHNKFTCPSQYVYFSASVFWGVIGPRRVFNAQYPVLKWCFFIGCFVPIPFWALDVYLPVILKKIRAKRAANAAHDVNGSEKPAGIEEPRYLRFLDSFSHGLRYFDPNVMFVGILNFFAPYNMSYIIMGFYVNWFFMKYVRTRYVAWFERYLYVLSAALTAGMGLSLIIIFFALQYNDRPLNWWGNEVFGAGIDGVGGPLKTLPEGDHFGPGPGEYFF